MEIRNAPEYIHLHIGKEMACEAVKTIWSEHRTVDERLAGWADMLQNGNMALEELGLTQLGMWHLFDPITEALLLLQNMLVASVRDEFSALRGLVNPGVA
jgi:hypothetical protein